MPLSQFDERTALTYAAQFVAPQAAGSIATQAGTLYGTRWDQMLLTWSGATPFEVDVAYNDSFGDIAFIGTVTVPGAVGTVMGSVDVITTLLPANQQFLLLQASAHIDVTTKATIAGSDVFSIFLSGGNF